MLLKKGCKYDFTSLDCTGWTNSNHDGYNYLDYFDPSGYYLGPDEYGIEPKFDETSIIKFR